MNAGDVCLAQFPYGGSAGRKVRPVVLITGPIGGVPEYVVAYVTSATPADSLPSDRWFDPADAAFASSGFSVRSLVRMHKVSTVHQRDLIRRLGALHPAALEDLRERLRRVIALG